MAPACVSDLPRLERPDSSPCAGVTFTDEEAEAHVGYSAADLLEGREWVFSQAWPVLGTTLDEAALAAEGTTTPARVTLEPTDVEVRPIPSFWADESNGRCVPDYRVSGQGSLHAPDIGVFFEGAVTMNRVLSANHPPGEPPVNETSFEVWLTSESPDLPEVYGLSPTHASARLFLLSSPRSVG